MKTIFFSIILVSIIFSVYAKPQPGSQKINIKSAVTDTIPKTKNKPKTVPANTSNRKIIRQPGNTPHTYIDDSTFLIKPPKAPRSRNRP